MRKRGLRSITRTASAAAAIRRLVTLASALLLAALSAPAASSMLFDGDQPAGGAVAVPAARQARNVAVITIDREIDRIMARSVERRMRLAEDAGADAIVFRLDTPGGDLLATLAICRRIKNSKIANTVAWIDPQAYSGGAVIALACREIVVADPAVMGDAAIVQFNPFSFKGLNELKETERQKMMGPLLSEIVDSARRRGHDERLVQGFVSRGVDLWMIQHVRTGQVMFVGKAEYRRVFGEDPPAGTPRIPAAAGSVPIQAEVGREASAARAAPAAGRDAREFVPAIPGLPGSVVKEVTDRQDLASQRPVLTSADRDEWRPVEFVSDGDGLLTLQSSDLLRYGLAAATVRSSDDLRAFFGASQVAVLDESWSESMVVFLNNLIVRAVLVIVFLVGLFIEMTHPGTVLPGTVAAGALLLLLAPPFLNDMANWWEVAAILLGVVLLALEVLVLPGFGVFGVLGLVLLFGGLVGTFMSNSEGVFPGSAKGRQDLLHGVLTIALSGVTSGVLIYFLSKHLGSLPVVSRLLLKDVHRQAGEEDEGLLAAMAVSRGVAVGDEGVALTPLRPAGRVQIGERIYDVVADVGVIPAGTPVRVTSVGEFRMIVERADGVAPGGPSGGGTA